MTDRQDALLQLIAAPVPPDLGWLGHTYTYGGTMKADRVWSYVDQCEPGEETDPKNPGARVVMRTEAQIIADYYEWWKTQMERVGRQDLISHDNCIEDWVVVHWASPVVQ